MAKIMSYNIYKNDRQTPTGGTAILVTNKVGSNAITIPDNVQDQFTTADNGLSPLTITKNEFT